MLNIFSLNYLIYPILTPFVILFCMSRRSEWYIGWFPRVNLFIGIWMKSVWKTSRQHHVTIMFQCFLFVRFFYTIIAVKLSQILDKKIATRIKVQIQTKTNYSLSKFAESQLIFSLKLFRNNFFLLQTKLIICFLCNGKRHRHLIAFIKSGV